MLYLVVLNYNRLEDNASADNEIVEMLGEKCGMTKNCFSSSHTPIVMVLFWALCILWSGVLERSFEVEQWSGVVKFWGGKWTGLF